MCVFLQKYFLSKVKIFSLRQYNQWSFITCKNIKIIHSLNLTTSGVAWLFQDRSGARPHQLQSARPVAPPQVRELSINRAPALIEWSFVYFFFQHSLGLCHCDHLWWRVDLCSKRHPERAWQGCEADVLGQVSIVEYSQIRTLKPLPHQVPKWSESESGGGSIAS